jgi:hypothetical protein
MFFCRLPLIVDITKIEKFFRSSQMVTIILSMDGVHFMNTIDGRCLYSVSIDKSDIYQIKCDNPNWKGIVRSFQMSTFTTMIDKLTKDKNYMEIELDDSDESVHHDNLEMKIRVISSNNTSVIDEKNVQLVKPIDIKKLPDMTFANVVINIHDFKIMSSELSKKQSITVSFQKGYVKIESDKVHTYGVLDVNTPLTTLCVDPLIFKKVTDINIGNIKNGMVGIYLEDNNPMRIKVKLGIIDFNIYGSLFLTQ